MYVCSKALGKYLSHLNICHGGKIGKLAFMTTSVDLEDTMLSEISQHRKTNSARCHLHVESKTVKLIEVESRVVVARDWGEGEIGSRM